MKKLSLFCLLLATTIAARAQGDWFDPTQKWNFNGFKGWVGEVFERVQPSGDSLIAGQVWKKMGVKTVFKNTGGISENVRVLRQDGLKIFGMDGSGPFLMYDFGLAVGEKVFLPSYGQTGTGYNYEVTAVGDTLVNGKLLKTQKVKWTNNGPGFGAQVGTFIEGMGCVEGLHIVAGEWCLSDCYLFLDEPAAGAVDGPERKFCSLTASWGQFEGLGKSLCAVSATDEPGEIGANVFPNPATMGRLNIQLSEPGEEVEISLTDLRGRAVFYQKWSARRLRLVQRSGRAFENGKGSRTAVGAAFLAPFFAARTRRRKVTGLEKRQSPRFCRTELPTTKPPFSRFPGGYFQPKIAAVETDLFPRLLPFSLPKTRRTDDGQRRDHRPVERRDAHRCLSSCSPSVAGQLGTSTGSIRFPSRNGPDSVVLKFSYLGFDPVFQKIKPGGSAVKLDVALPPAGAKLAEVVIKADEFQQKLATTEMSTTQLEVRDIKQIPVVFGESDILKALQLKPGFTPGTEGTTGLFVRGGAGDQNLIVLDEAVVYNPNHLFGFFSTFNSDAIKDLKVWKGGFPAQYGGRLSSVIDVRMKEGNNQNYEAEGGVGLIASRLTVEGPIEKGKSSFIVSGRRTYADLITRQINRANEDNANYNPIPDYYFYDLNTKVNFRLSERDRLFVSGYFGRDVFNYKDDQFNFSFDWGNATGTARLNHIYSPRLFSNTTFTYSDYRYLIANKLTGFFFRTDSNIKDVNLKHDFYFAPNERHTMRFGGGLTYHDFIVGRLKAGSDDGKISFSAGQGFDGTEMAAYFSDEWRATDRLSLNYGARLSGFANRPSFYAGIEPRLAANWAVSPRLSWKASYARMNQYVHLVSSSGISLPTDVWYPSTRRVKPEASDQIAAGGAYLLGKGLFLTAEAYYKWLHRQVELIDGANIFANDSLETQFAFGRGYATGLELELEKKTGKLTGWVGYQLALTERGGFPPDLINGGRFYPTNYDSRHILNVVAIWAWRRRLSLSATFTYQSGYARWLPSGRFTYQGVSGEQIDFVVPVFGERNTFRMPYYLRADLGVVWKFFPKWGRSDLTFSVYNATDRRNPFFIFLEPEFQTVDVGGGQTVEVPKAIRAKQVSLFPVLPTVTWNFAFGKSAEK